MLRKKSRIIQVYEQGRSLISPKCNCQERIVNSALVLMSLIKKRKKYITEETFEFIKV